MGSLPIPEPERALLLLDLPELSVREKKELGRIVKAYGEGSLVSSEGTEWEQQRLVDLLASNGRLREHIIEINSGANTDSRIVTLRTALVDSRRLLAEAVSDRDAMADKYRAKFTTHGAVL